MPSIVNAFSDHGEFRVGNLEAESFLPDAECSASAGLLKEISLPKGAFIGSGENHRH
jgi:hypothetical protein